MAEVHLQDVINELELRRPQMAGWEQVLQITPPDARRWARCNTVPVTDDAGVDADALIAEMMRWLDRGHGVSHIMTHGGTFYLGHVEV